MRGRSGRARRAVGAVLTAVIVAGAGTGCIARPADAPDPRAGEENDENGTTLVIAVDDIGEGFNPHLVSDLSPVTDLLAALSLPSSFVQVPTAGGGVDLRVDDTWLESAVPISQDPFIVRYRIRRQAQWSTDPQHPVDAANFRYLWEQMRRHPGVVGGEGYRHIVDVRETDSGKTVDVEFRTPYPRWRELFHHLVPTSLLQQEEDGFVGRSATPSGTAAGPYRVSSFDSGRGEILLERNYRHLGPQTGPEKITIRRITDPRVLVDGVRAGSIDLVLGRHGESARGALEVLTGATAGRFATGRSLVVDVDPRSRALADRAVRSEILGRLVNVDLVGIGSNGLAASSRDLDVLGRPVTPSRTDAAPVPEAAVVPHPPGEATSNRQSLVVGFPAADLTGSLVAGAIADVLRTAGFDVSTAALNRQAMAAGPRAAADLYVRWVRPESDTGAALADRFGCPTSPPAGSRAAAPPVADTRFVAPDAAVTCAPSFTNATDPAAVLDVLARASLTLPLFADQSFGVLRRGVVGPTAVDGTFVTNSRDGIFHDVTSWRRAG